MSRPITKLRTLLLDVENDKAEIIEIENTLDAFYDKLNCDCIDIVERKIDGKTFDVMCDDNGLFAVSKPKISAINDMGEVMFVGNLMFFNENGEGHIVSLSDADISHIMKNIRNMPTYKYLDGYKMLTRCEY